VNKILKGRNQSRGVTIHLLEMPKKLFKKLSCCFLDLLIIMCKKD